MAGLYMPFALCVHPADNVATLLEDSPPGAVDILGLPQAATIDAAEAISRGHKITLVSIAAPARSTRAPPRSIGTPERRRIRSMNRNNHGATEDTENS
jgi:hypothetical protein